MGEAATTIVAVTSPARVTSNGPVPGQGHHGGVAELRDLVRGNEMWDGQGRRWQRGRPRWLEARAVARWVRREGVVAFREPGDEQVTWWNAEQAAAWWAGSASALEVPGVTAATSDVMGRTYGASLWRSGQDRLLGLEAFC